MENSKRKLLKRFLYLTIISCIFCFVIPSGILAQEAFIVIDYMKVKPGNERSYLEIEQRWKEVHKKSHEAGLIEGWQIWRKLFAGEEDPYQYITITHYNSFAQTNKKYPEGFWDELMTQREYEVLMDETSESREMAAREVAHRVLKTKGSKEPGYYLVNRFHVTPGNEKEYKTMENEIWKPMHEESVRRNFRASWGIWEVFPFEENQPRFIAIDGYEKYSQIGTAEKEILKKVHPEMSWDKIEQKALQIREHKSSEIWELVDGL